MNKEKLFALMRTSLRYTNPQATEQHRKKGKSGKKLTRAIIFNYLFLAALFTVMYGLILFMTDFSERPGFFTMYVALFGVLSLSQGISVIFNIFFESKDLAAYLPLPFKQGEIFAAKILVVMLSVVPFMLPLLVLFGLTAWQSHLGIILAFIMALIAFCLFIGIILFICSLIVLGLTRLKIFQKHKKMMTTGLMFITTIVAVVGILLLQNSGEMDYSGASQGVVDRGIIWPLYPVFWAINHPFSLQGLIGWGSLLVLFAGLVLVIKVFFLPKLYEQLTDFSTHEGITKRKRRQGGSLNRLLRSYNIQLIKDPNLVMQILSTSVVMPVVMLISSGGAVRGAFGSGLPTKMVGVVFVGGLLLAFLSCNSNSFVANIISLDGENFDYILALPISKKAYLKQKFLIGFTIQAVIALVMAVAAAIMIGLSPVLILGLVGGALLGSLVMSLFFFARDYRLLATNWTSVTQLFQRGGGNVATAISMFLGVFVGFIVLIIYAMAAFSLPFAPLNIFVMGGLLLICGGVIVYFKRQFWNKVDQLNWQRRITLAEKKPKGAFSAKKFSK